MNTNHKAILHVDDDPDDRELLREIMEVVAPDIKVASAKNGLEALKLLTDSKEKQSLPCLIVLDLNMPFLNGRETIERIKTDPHLNNIPVVVFSSGENPAEKSRFIKEGVQYFTKPIQYSAMEEIVRQMATLCG